MNEITLRPARSTDAGKAAAFMSDYMEQTPWMPRIHTGAEDIGFVASMIERGWVTVAVHGDAVIGFLARDGDDIQALYIAQSQWRKGAGSALLNHAQGFVARLSLWTFQANTQAQAFYAAHGFNEVERTDGAGNDEHLPDIRFEWHKEAA